HHRLFALVDLPLFGNVLENRVQVLLWDPEGGPERVAGVPAEGRSRRENRANVGAEPGLAGSLEETLGFGDRELALARLVLTGRGRGCGEGPLALTLAR